MEHRLHVLRRLIILFSTGIMLLTGFHESVYGEGTKQVRPDSTVSAAALMIDWSDPLFTRFCSAGCPSNFRLNIHISNIGEKILFGLKTPYGSIGWALKRPNGTIPAGMSGNNYPGAGTGYIQYYRQAIVGPFPALGGYTPLQFTADMVGDWYFELTDVHIDPGYPASWGPTGIFDLWDFQVVSGINTPALPADTLNGRVWSQSWQMYARLESPNPRYFNGSLYVYSDDGIVTKLVCNGMGMGEGTFFCNETGCTNIGNIPVDRQSMNSNTYVGFPAIAQYKVFLNNPDQAVYPDGSYGQLNSVSYHNDTTEPCSWNKYLIINVNKGGQIVIKIDIPYGDPSYDVQLIANVVPGDNIIPWDGLDGHGNPVPSGTVITITVDFLNGLTNLPLWDFEGNPNGFKVYPVRPIGPGLNSPMFYWDDSQIIATGGTSTSCSNPPTTVNLTGCAPASSVCHDWPAMCHNKMINTWWYSGSATSILADIVFKAQPKPTITGLDAVCPFTNGVVYTTEPGMGNYLWSVSAGGTITSGGGVNDNSVTINWGATGTRTITLTYTGTNGCPSLVTTKTIQVSNALPVSVSIVASENPVCVGTTVTFTATPTNGGLAPSYQWSVNGVNQGPNSPTYTFIPTNGNVVRCRLTSNLGSCVTGNPANSNAITMTVSNPLITSVTISATSNNICAGEPVTFTAFPVNGGGSPTYQWQVNGTGAGTNSPTFTYYPSDNDVVRCRLTSSLWCSSGIATSNSIIMNVNIRPIPSINGPATVCAGTAGNVYQTAINMSNYIWVVSAGGTITAGGGTTNRTVTVTWNTAGPQTVSVNYNSGNGCPAITPTVYNVTVNPRPVPVITGPSSACVGSAGNVYTTESGMSAYNWVVSGGGTITAGAGTNAVTVRWNTAGAQTIRVNYTNSFGCTTATPTIYNVNVSNILPVSISISASSNPVCSGTLVTFTATPINGGSTPVYQWIVNGANSGTNSPIFSYTPVNGDLVSCVLTSNLSCVSPSFNTSNIITMVVNPVMPVSVAIAASSNPVCTGTSVTFTATPTNGGTTPAYQWKVNGVNQGSNSSTYSFIPINGQIVTCVLTSNITCPTGNPATSNAITMNVGPVMPVSVSIAASSNTVCAGTSVTFTATPTNGGTTPAYQWKVNGINAGANSTTYSYTPVTGDVITCVLTSNVTCSSGNPATSNAITMTVNPVMPVSVAIAASSNPVCAGTSVTFTATPTNGGTTPAYQWKVNGINAGANSTTYSYTPVTGDVITCVLTSNVTCPSGNPATSNTITMVVNASTAITVQPLNSTVNLGANTSFSVTATGLGLSYQWQVNTGSGWANVINGGVYSGAMTATLTLTGVTAIMNGNLYRCIVTGTCGTVTSDSAILTVRVPPDITCPADVNQTNGAGLCSALLDPGFPTLVSGTLPVTFTWTMTGATTGAGSGAVTPVPYTFNVGITTINWRATNMVGFDECIQTITVVDNQKPTFTAPLPKSFCVEDIYLASYYDPTMDITPNRPEYYLFETGNTDLNLIPATFADNCTLGCGVEIRWRISFFDGTYLPVLPSLYNTGQPSAYSSNFQLPGSVTGDVIHTITYQIVDCNGNVSLPQTVNITITPRPNVIKQP